MMKGNSKGFWPALERIPGLAAVEAEWRNYMGNDYELGKAFLRPNGRLAASHPCVVPRGCGCNHDVIVHSDENIEAVCHCESGCDTFALKRTDIVVYELDRTRLDSALAEVFGLIRASHSSTDLQETHLVGVYSPFAGYRFNVYLMIQLERGEFNAVVDGLTSRADRPFILLAPTRDFYTAMTEARLAQRKSAFVPLSENAAVTANRNLHLLHTPEEILQEFRTTNLPSPKGDDTMAFFPTPADSKWSDVSIRFKDGFTVSSKAKSAAGVFNYTQMGMANRKNGEPTLQWELLRAFANAHGTLDWSSNQAHRRNQKRRELLAADLRAFFCIEGDPFRLTEDGQGWRTRFQLSPD